MAYNKFMKKDGTVMLSLLEDTVTAETLQQGVTAHNRSGEAVAGTLDPNASLNAYATQLATIVGDNTQTPGDVEQELNYLLETANRATGVIESTLAETINNLVDGYGANGVVVGKRKFIESPAVPTTYITQQVNFTVIDNNKLTNYTQMGAGKVDNENRISYGSVIYTSTDGWQDENLKIIDFGETPQTVLGEFAQFIANNTEDIDERIVEVATETEMNELFLLAENGTVFKYVGETGTYENGALYIVEEEASNGYTVTINYTNMLDPWNEQDGDALLAQINDGGWENVAENSGYTKTLTNVSTIKFRVYNSNSKDELKYGGFYSTDIIQMTSADGLAPFDSETITLNEDITLYFYGDL